MKDKVLREQSVNSWTEYHEIINTLRDTYPGRVIYYRGQPSYDMKLESTLERVAKKTELNFVDYCRDILKIAGFVQSVTGLTFDLSELKEIAITKNDSFDSNGIVPSYPYWVFLRQHGFPSPMLDWTSSPTIAAFFALWECKCESCVWAYIERPEGFKLGGNDMTNIKLLGPYTPGEKRHFIQKSVYTLAWSWDMENNCRVIKPYESIRKELDQDILIKVGLSLSMREQVLKELDKSNLNIYTLMEDVDSLMKYLAYRQFG
jgi:hypothetical protein